LVTEHSKHSIDLNKIETRIPAFDSEEKYNGGRKGGIQKMKSMLREKAM
jgi:hypothetical protein